MATDNGFDPNLSAGTGTYGYDVVDSEGKSIGRTDVSSVGRGKDGSTVYEAPGGGFSSTPKSSVEFNKDTGKITINIPKQYAEDEKIKNYLDNATISNLSANYKANKEVSYQDPTKPDDENAKINTEQMVGFINEAVQDRVTSLWGTPRAQVDLISAFGGTDEKNEAIKKLTADDMIVMSATGVGDNANDDSSIALPQWLQDMYPQVKELSSFSNGFVKRKDFLENFYNVSGGISTDDVKKIQQSTQAALQNVENWSSDEIARNAAFATFLTKQDPNRSDWDAFWTRVGCTAEGWDAGLYANVARGLDTLVNFFNSATLGGQLMKAAGVNGIPIQEMMGAGENGPLADFVKNRAEMSALINQNDLDFFQAGYIAGGVAEQLVETTLLSVAGGEIMKGIASSIEAKAAEKVASEIAAEGDVVLQNGLTSAAGGAEFSTAPLRIAAKSGAPKIAGGTIESVTENMWKVVGSDKGLFTRIMGNAANIYLKNLGGTQVVLNAMSLPQLVNIANSAYQITKMTEFAETTAGLMSSFITAAIVTDPDLTNKIVSNEAAPDEVKLWLTQAAETTAVFGGLGVAANTTAGRALSSGIRESAVGRKATEIANVINERASRGVQRVTNTVSGPYLKFRKWLTDKQAVAEALSNRKIKSAQAVREAMVMQDVNQWVADQPTAGEVAKTESTITNAATGNVSPYRQAQGVKVEMENRLTTWEDLAGAESSLISRFTNPDVEPVISQDVSEYLDANTKLLKLEEAAGLLGSETLKKNKTLAGENDIDARLYMGHSKSVSVYAVRSYELERAINISAVNNQPLNESNELYQAAKKARDDAAKNLPSEIVNTIDTELLPTLENSAYSITNYAIDPSVGLLPRKTILGLRNSGEWGVDGRGYIPLVARREPPKGTYTPKSGMAQRDNAMDIYSWKVLPDDDITWIGNGLNRLIREIAYAEQDKSLVNTAKKADGMVVRKVVSGEQTEASAQIKTFKSGFKSAVRKSMSGFGEDVEMSDAVFKKNKPRVKTEGGVEIAGELPSGEANRPKLLEKGPIILEADIEHTRASGVLAADPELVREEMEGAGVLTSDSVIDQDSFDEYYKQSNDAAKNVLAKNFSNDAMLDAQPRDKSIDAEAAPNDVESYKALTNNLDKKLKAELNGFEKEVIDEYYKTLMSTDVNGGVDMIAIPQDYGGNKYRRVSYNQPIYLEYYRENGNRKPTKKQVRQDWNIAMGKEEALEEYGAHTPQDRVKAQREAIDRLDGLRMFNENVISVSDYKDALELLREGSKVDFDKLAKMRNENPVNAQNILDEADKLNAYEKLPDRAEAITKIGEQTRKDMRDFWVENIYDVDLSYEVEVPKATEKGAKAKNKPKDNLKYKIDEEQFITDVDDAIDGLISTVSLSSDAQLYLDGVNTLTNTGAPAIRRKFDILDAILAKENKDIFDKTIRITARKLVDSSIPKNRAIIKGNLDSLYRKAEKIIKDRFVSHLAEAKTTLESLGEEVNSQTVSDIMKELDTEIMGYANGETYIETTDNLGRTEIYEVSPAFGALYNNRPVYNPVSTPIEVLRTLQITKRIFQTNLSARSHAKQAASDTILNFVTTGAMPPIPGLYTLPEQEITGVFGTRAAAEIQATNPYRWENIKMVAEREGISIEEAILRNTRGISESQLPFTAMSQEVMRQAGTAKYGVDYQNLVARQGGVKGITRRINRRLSKVSNTLGKLNDTRETSTRVAGGIQLQRWALEHGFPYTVAEEFRQFGIDNATTNFRTKHTLLNGLRLTTPYIAAGMSGAKSFWKMFELDPLGVTSRIITGLVIPIMWFTGEILDDERLREQYENLADFEKEDHIIIAVGGSLVRIPVGEELGSITNPIIHLVENLNGQSKYNFWGLMLNDLVGLNPVLDLTGFTDPDLYNDFANEAPSFWEIWDNGVSKILASAMPPVAQSVYMAASGRDLYTGKSIDSTKVTIDDEGNAVIMSSSQSEFATAMANIIGGDARVIEKVTSGIFGTTTTNVLDTITSAVQYVSTGGEQGSLLTGIGKTVSDITNPYAAVGYDDPERKWWQDVKALQNLKAEIEHGDAKINKYIAYNNQISQEKNPATRRDLINKRNALLTEYQQKVANLVKNYRNAGGALNGYKFSQVTSLLTFEDALRADRQFLGLNTQYQDARAQALRTLNEMGIKNPEGASMLGYIYFDNQGQEQVKLWTPAQMQIVNNVYYSQGSIHQARIEAIIDNGTDGSVKSLKKQEEASEQPYWDKYNSTGKLSNAEWSAIDDLRKAYNAQVVIALNNYINAYGPEYVLSDETVLDYLENIIKVPSEYETVNNRYVSSGGGKLNKTQGFVRSYIKEIFGVK